jgi:microcystin-dependent protein
MLKNLVEETSNNPGTGTTVVLGGAPAGRQTWRGSGFASNSQAFYFITDGTIGEWGICTVVLSTSDSITRDTVIGNTSGTTSRLNFTGTCRVYNAIPSEKALYSGVGSVGLTGDVVITKAQPQVILDKTGAAQGSVLVGRRSGTYRWAVQLGNQATETGTSNAGSDFAVDRYSDTGVYLDTPFTLARSNGLASFGAAGITTTGGITASGGLTTSGGVSAASMTVSGTSNAASVQQKGALLLPPGVMFPYCGSTAPVGYLLCDGAAVSRTVYAALFEAIGATYGAGDGLNTFNVPDTRNKFLIGTSTTYTLGSTGGSAVGTSSSEGAHNHGGFVGGISLTISQLPAHNHTATADSQGIHQHTYSYPNVVTGPVLAGSGSGYKLEGVGTLTDGQGAHAHTITVNNAGSGATHNHPVPNETAHAHTTPTVPPYLAINHIIKT